MQYPTDLKPLSLQRQMTQVFGGYDATDTCPENAFCQMENLSSDHYPLLHPRHSRGVHTAARQPGAMIGKDAFCYVDGTEFRINDHPVEGLTLENHCDRCPRRLHCKRYAPGKEECPRTLVGMGAWVILLPDAVAVNTADGSIRELEAYFQAEAASFVPCNLSGAALAFSLSATPPEDKSLAWIDQTAGCLKRWSEATETWIEQVTCYVRIDAPGIGNAFAQGDTICLGKLEALPQLEGYQTIWAKGEDYIVITGFCPGAFTQPLQAERTLPDMDFVIESKNRLWGCKYGIVEGVTVNEIYGSKLGDPTNWHSFLGISTDSQSISCGTDGPWTGAFSLDTPLFFKEDRLHRIYGDQAPFGLQITPCHGVESGSSKSLAAVGQVLFYKSPFGVMAYDGALPVPISQPLGQERYTQGVGGVLGNKYYLSLVDSRQKPHLFVYDTLRRLWHREDGLKAEEFCTCRGQLYIRAEGKLLTVLGQEEQVAWEAVTGQIGAADPDGKYLLRLNLGLRMPPGSSLALWICYDGSDIWEPVTRLTGKQLVGAQLPIRPRRCHRLQLKLAGVGQISLCSLTKTMAWGGELP